ncbi:DUF2459 domain-containing protein [Winogradskyella sp. HB-48]|uniref:DUF2459 domain-containing protein n=1 Tax=Winogradskyella sp. HB-48 TaxID=3416808 RepID=UPI003CFB508C
MKVLKLIFRYLLYLLLLPVTYILVSLFLGSISVNEEQDEATHTDKIYLSTNGVHLDIIIPRDNINEELLTGLKYNETDKFFAFGWGDENFYLNTPTWSDLTFNNAFGAMFLNSSSLMHVSRYNEHRRDWVEVKLSEKQLQNINSKVLNAFMLDSENSKIILEDKGYGFKDDFYRAKGSYSILKTCNSWVNTTFKESELKASVWTPFDFALINKYK